MCCKLLVRLVGMLQCVAVCGLVNVFESCLCCSVLQCVAVCCSVLQVVGALSWDAVVCCSVLQCAVCCSVLSSRFNRELCVLQCVAVCCSVLQ